MKIITTLSSAQQPQKHINIHTHTLTECDQHNQATLSLGFSCVCCNFMDVRSSCLWAQSPFLLHPGLLPLKINPQHSAEILQDFTLYPVDSCALPPDHSVHHCSPELSEHYAARVGASMLKYYSLVVLYSTQDESIKVF